MNENEVWKDVVGYEGLYKVSDKGNVYSVERLNSRGRKIGGRIMKPTPNTNGYLRVNLCKDGKTKSKLVHRLVLEAFVGNPNNLPQVNHIDENKTNNELSNLEWCTGEQNINHGTRNERTRKKVRAVNVKNGEVTTFSSIVEAERKGYNSGGVAAACKGIYKNTSGKLIGGDGRTYKGYRWYYEDNVVE